MFAPILAAVVSLAPAPILPAGLNGPFYKQCYKVEQLLHDSKFEEATAAAALLPKAQATYSWDESAVPEGWKKAYKEAFAEALAEWKPVIELTRSSGSAADIAFTFSKSLPPDTKSGLPAGASFEFENGAPRLNVVLALNRLDPLEPSGKEDIHNECEFAISQYLGFERSLSFGVASSRTDESTTVKVRPSRAELEYAKTTLGIADTLRHMSESHQTVELSKPAMGLSTLEVPLITGVQDQPLGFQVTVFNKGNSDLLLNVRPDCGCLQPFAPSTVAPGESAEISTVVNTHIYQGHMNHDLLVYSNDPDWPVAQVSVKLDIQPLFHFYQPGGNQVEAGPNGFETDLYLFLAGEANFNILTASLAGSQGKIVFHPWKGVMPGDVLGDGKEEHGFKFHIHVDPPPFAGRIPTSLILGTDDEQSPELSDSFYLQKGIVTSPGDIYIGTIPAEPKQFSFLLIGSLKGFHVTGVDTGSPFLKATVVPTEGDRQYRIDILFDGRANPGAFQSKIVVHTTDPKQPEISVPIHGLIQ